MKPIEKIVRHLLEGAEMSGFEYSTGLTLRLDHYQTDLRHEPAVVELHFSCEARLSFAGANWDHLLSCFPVVTNQPSQPLLAALLVGLRWDGGPVKLAHVDGAVLRVEFEDGSVLVVEGDPTGMGVDWAVYEGGSLLHQSEWSVIHEGGAVEVHCPDTFPTTTNEP